MINTKNYLTLKNKIKKQKQINHNTLAKEILKQENIITINDTKEIYTYNKKTHLYEPCEPELNTLIQYCTDDKAKTYLVNEVKATIQRLTYINRNQIAQNTDLIPLKNKIYNFKTQKTQEYTPKTIFLTKHETSWINPEKDWNNNPINKFLEEITENQEDITLLKELAGYCFYRKMPFQHFFILVGTGANGKSVYLNILRKMLGEENVSNIALQDMNDKFLKIQFYNKNANIFGDLPKKAFDDVGVIKQLTGGDSICADVKFKGAINFYNYAKLISSCNEVPETPDISDGFFRRAVIINFPNSFDGKENRNLLEELTTEQNLSQFFQESITAFKKAIERNNLVRQESIETRKEKYMIYSNSAISFCNYYLDYDPQSELKVDYIYSQYAKYCTEKKVPEKDNVNFFKSLYKYFGHKVWKSRLSNDNERYFVIKGVCEKDPSMWQNYLGSGKNV